MGPRISIIEDDDDVGSVRSSRVEAERPRTCLTAGVRPAGPFRPPEAEGPPVVASSAEVGIDHAFDALGFDSGGGGTGRDGRAGSCESRGARAPAGFGGNGGGFGSADARAKDGFGGNGGGASAESSIEGGRDPDGPSVCAEDKDA